jgi:hypothetical protein
MWFDQRINGRALHEGTQERQISACGLSNRAPGHVPDGCPLSGKAACQRTFRFGSDVPISTIIAVQDLILDGWSK